MQEDRKTREWGASIARRPSVCPLLRTPHFIECSGGRRRLSSRYVSCEYRWLVLFHHSVFFLLEVGLFFAAHGWVVFGLREGREVDYCTTVLLSQQSFPILCYADAVRASLPRIICRSRRCWSIHSKCRSITLS